MAPALDHNTYASNPGGFALSDELMSFFHPELYSGGGWLGDLSRAFGDQRSRLAYDRDHLWSGDSRAAVVVSVDPLLVAAYSDEFDCVALLLFPQALVQRHRLALHSRLLTVNTYEQGSKLVYDLDLGPYAQSQWVNFFPYIADFLTADLARLNERKSQIVEAEWDRTLELGHKYLVDHPGYVRDGMPHHVWIPAREFSIVATVQQAHQPDARSLD